MEESSCDSKKLGIIGGSFDPVHKGHLSSAEFVYRTLNLDKVIFVPAFIAPHKIGLEFAPAADRYRMTELAVQDYPYFDVSDVELKRSGISYTYDTVLELKSSIRDMSCILLLVRIPCLSLIHGTIFMNY